MKTITLSFFMGLCVLTSAQTLKDAVNKTNNERYADAIVDFTTLLKATPNSGDIYFYLGDCYYKKGLQDSSILAWEQGFSADKISPMSYVGYYRVYWLKGDKANAEATCTKAFEMTKKNKVKRAEVLRGMAEIMITSDNKDLVKASLFLDEAIEKDPNNEDNLLLKGDVLYAQTPQDASPAIKFYNQVLEKNPKSPRGKLRVANIYQAAQNFDEANKIYKEAIAIDSTYAPAYRERAEMMMRFNKMKLAIQDWKKYLVLNNNPESRYRCANALYVAKQYCEVIKEVTFLNENGLRNYFTERFLATSYLNCAEVEEANQKGLDASDRFFASAPESAVNFLDYKARGELLLKLGKDSLVVIEWEKAASMNESAAKELTDDIARLYKKQKLFDQAIETYLKRQAAFNLSLPELYDLGQCYYAGPQNFKEADTLFAQVAIKSPEYAPAYLWRGRCMGKLDPENENWLSKPYYGKVLELVVGDDRKLDKNKKMVIESAKYLGAYYGASVEKDPSTSKGYFQIVYDLDPNDKQAKEVLGIK